MHPHKAAEIVGYSRRRAKSVGCMLWVLILLSAIVGWVLWSPYAVPLALLLAFAFGLIYSKIEMRRIERITGFGGSDQQRLYTQSAAARLDPIARNPTLYRRYIESLPDEDTEGEVNSVISHAKGANLSSRWSEKCLRSSQIVDYAFYLLYSLMTIRFILTLLGADPAASFVRFVMSITSPFYAPFDGIIESVVVEGRYLLDVPLIIAMVVYAMFHFAITKLLRTIAYPRASL